MAAVMEQTNPFLAGVFDHDQVRAEEKAALKREKNLERARAIQAKQRETSFGKKVRTEASKLKRKPAHRSCKCDFHGIRTADDLMQFKGCKDPVYVCPVLAGVRTKV